MKRSIALLALLLLTAGACGGGDDTDTTSARRASPTPTGATTAPTPTDEGEQDVAEDDAAAPADEGEPDSTNDGDGGNDTNGNGDGDGSDSQQAAGEGQVNPPKTGEYVYDMDGSRTNPFCPTGCDYPDDATSTVAISRDGSVYTSKQTNSEESGSTTTRTRWEDDRTLLLFTKAEGFVEFNCTFEPPVEILHIPVQPETFPTQQWSSDGCEGTTDITVVGQEDVEDANGETWSTWKIEQETDYTFESNQGTIDGTLRTTTWLAPDLGTSVVNHARNDGTLTTETGPPQDFHQDTTTTLRSHP